MKILFAARAGNTLIFGQTRAPAQARRRLVAALGSPVTIAWVGLPAPGVASADLIEAAGTRIGRISKLVDSELGTVVLSRVASSRSIDHEFIAATIRTATLHLKGSPFRSCRFERGGFTAFIRSVQAFFAKSSGASAS